MKNIQEIKKEDIREKVMYEIGKAKKEILATMNIDEDQKFPLPKEYFSLMKKKHKKGVKIKRIVFGSVKKYNNYLQEIKDKKLFFTGKYTKSRNYKRMIMIDGDKLFFRNKINKNTKFYFTEDDKYIKEYKTYFDKFK